MMNLMEKIRAAHEIAQEANCNENKFYFWEKGKDRVRTTR
jgi:uncharacterized membrane protein